MSADPLALYGTAESEPELQAFSAGALHVDFQAGNLRTLRYRGHEVLRGIAFLVRDRDWGTCDAEISNLAVEEAGGAFSLRYNARFTAPSGAHLDCAIHISGSPEELVFSADCRSDGAFETARAGFVVLHPIVGLAGEPVSIRHTDGTVDEARWPLEIEPWQPFKDIAAITHHVAPGIAAETVFSGDVFEMEDQRNWTDASYKTYVRPLALPWPYTISEAEPFSQRIVVTMREQEGARSAAPNDGPVSLELQPTEAVFPELGIALRPECLTTERNAVGTLEKIGAGHLIAHFDPLAGHGAEAIRNYAELQALSGLPLTLEFAVPCQAPFETEMADLAKLVADAELTLDTIFVSPAVDRQSTPPGSEWPACPPLEDVYRAARAAFPGIRLGGGMMSYFTELNRKRVPADAIDYVSHCTNPIVHAADDLSVMQTFEALRHVVASMRAIYGDKPYRIGPSTIAMRQNPYGSATKDNPLLRRIPMSNIDPRHNGAFGAAWTLAYAATVAEADLKLLTLSTLAGPFGLVAGANEPVEEGAFRPLAHVLARLGALAKRPVVAVRSSRPDCVLGLATTDRLLLSNITPVAQRIAMPVTARGITMIGVKEDAALSGEVLTLPAYGCAEIVY